MSKPPLFPAVLLAAAQPLDYESISGDLDEEYHLRTQSLGRTSADRWYWSQVMRSLPSLLSYSRARNTPAGNVAVAVTVACLLFIMLFFKELVDSAIHAVYHPAVSSVHIWPYFPADWLVAVLFGALLVAMVRPHEIRIAIIAPLVLVSAFVLPIILGLSPPLSALTWLLILGAIPAMTAGGLVYHFLRKP